MTKIQLQKKHNIKINIRISYPKDNKGYYFNCLIIKNNESEKISAIKLNSKSLRFNNREEFYNKLNEYLSMKEDK